MTGGSNDEWWAMAPPLVLTLVAGVSKERYDPGALLRHAQGDIATDALP
jgi:hypothetical protein